MTKKAIWLLWVAIWAGGPLWAQQLVEKDKVAPIYSEALLGTWVQQQLLGTRPVAGSLALSYAKTSPGGRHFSFVQQLDGVPVSGTQIKLTTYPDGRVMRIKGNWMSRLPQADYPAQVDTTALTTQAALRYGGKVFTQGRIYWQTPKQLVPAWLVETIHEADGGSHATVWDAHTHTLLAEWDRTRHMGDRDTTALAYVYMPNPLATAGRSYNQYPSWADNADQANDSLNGQRQTVILKGLHYDAQKDSIYLIGPYVRITELGGPAIPPVRTKDAEFFFDRSQYGFEQVNVYYHIDTMQRWVQSLGFTDLFNDTIEVDAQAQTADNSFFSPMGSQGQLLIGTGGVDDGEDAEVVVHEYGHALSNAASPDNRDGMERSAIEEGTADYICASYSRAVGDNTWAKLFDWDGHNPFWPGRTAATTKTYTSLKAQNSTYNYAYGEVWCTALMWIWTDHGREMTDRLVLQGMYQHLSNMTMADGVHDLLDADTLLYDGAMSPAIYTAFCKMGVLTGAECEGYVSRKTEDVAEGTIQVYPVPFDNKLTLAPAAPGTGITYTVYNAAGQIMTKGYSKENCNIDTVGWPAGMYFVQIQTEAGKYFVRKAFKSY